jgi:CRP-like cAMP-binding protein
MMVIGNESNKERLEKIIIQEIVPKLEILAGPLPDECIEYLISNCKLKQVSKDQYVENNGSYEDGHLIFLFSGIAQSFYYDRETDKTFITRLWKKDDVIFDATSFTNNEDRKESIQMLEEGEFISIVYYHLKSILNRFPQLIALFSYLQIEREKYSRFYQHLLKSTVEERVNLFLQYNPTLIHRINKDVIALYLGMSRGRFSMTYSSYKQNKEN